ncbi:DNA-processing protein DprA [Candidatus Ruminimicrobiellum ovillum]|uniref:DNA-processing protein DprA n=1 Tax=Candidatus Ruminimicrobiellum ovillum TaxID=1947927 RepID=UPI003559F4B2
MDNEQLSVISLNTIADLVPKKFISLADYFGGANNIINADIKELESFGLSNKVAKSIKSLANFEVATKELTLAEKNNIKVLTYLDEEYPYQLKNICDYPPVIYVKGNFDKNDNLSVSVVGSRRPTNYGLMVTEKFCKYFAQNSITTISGLAGGIDTQAHSSTIKNSGRTVAVLGNGLLECYPSENRKLQNEIGEKGVVISEFPLTRKALPMNFPRRNRIVAALSLATIVIEAAEKSGSLITANLACDYGKDVFAVPGPVFSKYSQGPNSLIKQGAFVALSPEDVSEQVPLLSDWVRKNIKKKKKEIVKNLPLISQSSINILKMIQSSATGMSLDEISLKANVNVSEVSAILLDLELNGLIKAMPGQIYIRNT